MIQKQLSVHPACGGRMKEFCGIRSTRDTREGDLHRPVSIQERRLMTVVDARELVICCTNTWHWLWDDGKNSILNLLRSFLALVEEPDCLTILTYFSKTANEKRLLGSIASHIQRHARIDITLGKPGDVHNRAQSGGATSVFIVIAKNPERGCRSPARSTSGSASKARAVDDFLALDDHGQRAILILLSEPSTGGLQFLDRSLAALL